MKKLSLILLALLAFGQVVWAQTQEPVQYISRSWNDSEVVATEQTISDYIELSGNHSSEELTLSAGVYYVVRDSNVKYRRLIAPYDPTPAYLILCDGAKLTAQITVEVNANGTQSLTIFGQTNDSGELVANGYYRLIDPDSFYTAGIGSSGRYNMGTLVIHGGTINASSATTEYSAGIGGGGCLTKEFKQTSNGGDITIYGGNVTAQAGEQGGAAIGGGVHYVSKGGSTYGGTGGTLTVYGGSVHAECTGRNRNGAGIGGAIYAAGGSVEVYGGNVYAKGGAGAAGIGSGVQYRGEIGGGSLTVHGGRVEAHGGVCGAGIGGGQNANGAQVTVNGGVVSAYGGTDAAGIGSGEETTFGPHIAGGSLTVNGGTVFADGTGWGAGIGGGEDADGATVVITGGSVTAWAGADAGNKNGCAIGSEDGDGHRGSLQIGDAMMVHAGQNPTDANAHLFPSATRVPACFYRPYAKIELCDHQGATYTINGTDANGTHTRHCTHCLVSETHTHTFVDGVCTVCGVSGSVSTVSVYLPVYDSGTNTYSYSTSPRWTVQLVTNSSFELPTPEASYLPAGVRFVGWRIGIGSPTELGLSDPRVTENESGLYLAGTNYTVTGDVSLTPRYKTFHVFTKAGNWNEPSNWCWNTVPTPDKEILIAAAANIPDGCTAQTGNSLTLDLEGTITIADGGQLLHTNEVNVTLQKTIAGFGSDNAAQTGWYTIASPVTTNITPAGNMLANTYDLYFYDETSHYWRNHKEHIVDGQNTASNFNIEPNKGYLYANSANTTLNFAGNTRATDATVTIPLSYTSENASLKGFNLVGNPFTRNLTSGDVIKIGNETFSAYYVADGSVANGKNLIACNIADRAIKPGEGFLVQATEASQNLVFNYTTRGEAVPQPAFVCVEAGNESFMDRAYLQLGQGNTLRKMSISDETPKVYMTHEGDDYAAVTLEATEGEMPVGFKAATDGTYTLTVSTKGIEANYLHLIDNMTGADVDLLATSSYTFTAKTTDYESRFKLVFSSICGDADGDNESFAFINNGEIIVTDADANATLQVIDVMGRVLVSHKGDVSGNVSTAGMTPGVYVLRLINGDDVKTQKIVINNP